MVELNREQDEIPQGIILKPSTQLQPEEIIKRVGGFFEENVAKGLMPPGSWSVECFDAGSLVINKRNYSEYSLKLYGLAFGTLEVIATDSEVILGTDFVTFVGPIARSNVLLGTDHVEIESISWFTIERGGLSLMSRIRQVDEAWPAEITPYILRAAANIQARTPPVGKR